MSPGNPARLLRLVDREFRDLTGEPARSSPAPRFKALKLNPARFDRAWDRKRGSAVRLMAVVLREDHEALQRRVCENEQTAKTEESSQADGRAYTPSAALGYHKAGDGHDCAVRGTARRREDGGGLAVRMNDLSCPTPRGAVRTPAAVSRLLVRLGMHSPAKRAP